MRVLVVTSATQGASEHDFHHALDGELVRLPFVECDDADRCGCGRAFTGLASHRATTTVEIAERPEIDPDLYLDLLVSAAVDDLDLARPDDPELRSALRDELAWLTECATRWSPGTVLERRARTIRPRADAPHQQM